MSQTGQHTVTTSPTPVTASPTNFLGGSCIKASPENTGPIFIAENNPSVSTTTGFELAPGDPYPPPGSNIPPPQDLSTVYVVKGALTLTAMVTWDGN
jgi:hypothetical protein